jgi:hypothetical protein
MQKKDKVSCTKYVMNMQAANFGECICGAARDAHEDAALDKEKAKNDRRDSGEARWPHPAPPQHAAGKEKARNDRRNKNTKGALPRRARLRTAPARCGEGRALFRRSLDGAQSERHFNERSGRRYAELWKPSQGDL